MASQILYVWRRVLFAVAVGVVQTSVPALAKGACSTKSATTPAPVCVNLGNCTNVDAWGLQVELSNGGGAAQRLCLAPSSVINATYVIGSEICNNDRSNRTCESSHGGTLDSNGIFGSSTQNKPTAAVDTPVETFWNDLNTPVQNFGSVDFGLAGFTELDGFEIGVVTNGTKFNLGQLGLGPRSTFLQSLKKAGYIDNLTFGFDAGSQSVINPRPGHLVLGGYDRSRVLGNFVEFDINYEPTEFRPCPFRVEIKTVDVSFGNGTKSEAFIELESRNPYACIEPYDNLFRFPGSRLKSLDSTSIGFGNDREPPDEDVGLHINEPGWRYKNENQPAEFSLNFTLKGEVEDLRVIVPNEELQHPLRGLDANGTYTTSRNYTELNIFEESAVRNTIVLGKAFLSQVYLAVDYEKGKFYLAASSTSPGNTCDPVPLACDDLETEENQTKVSGYIGLALGIAALVIIIAIVAWFIWFWTTGRLIRKLRGPGVNITTRDAEQGYSQQNTMSLRFNARQNSVSTMKRNVNAATTVENMTDNQRKGSVSPTSSH